MLLTIFRLSQTTSSTVAKTGSKLGPMIQPYLPLVVARHELHTVMMTCTSETYPVSKKKYVVYLTGFPLRPV